MNKEKWFWKNGKELEEIVIENCSVCNFFNEACPFIDFNNKFCLAEFEKDCPLKKKTFIVRLK